jgi:hypothetical protein
MSNYKDLNPNTERNVVCFFALATIAGVIGSVGYHVLATPGNTVWNPALIFWCGVSLFWTVVFLLKTIGE